MQMQSHVSTRSNSNIIFLLLCDLHRSPPLTSLMAVFSYSLKCLLSYIACGFTCHWLWDANANCLKSKQYCISSHIFIFQRWKFYIRLSWISISPPADMQHFAAFMTHPETLLLDIFFLSFLQTSLKDGWLLFKNCRWVIVSASLWRWTTGILVAGNARYTFYSFNWLEPFHTDFSLTPPYTPVNESAGLWKLVILDEPFWM